MQQEKRSLLSLFDMTMIVIGLVIGLGIFRTASDAARAAVTPNVFFLAWLFGGFIALSGALTYAEIGSRYPITGGYYKIFAVAYHPSIAFAINCIILISNATSLSGVALIGSEYLGQVIFDNPPSDLTQSLMAMGAIILFYLINLLGLKFSAKTQNVLMMIKIGMLLMLILALFFPAKHAVVQQAVVQEGSFSTMAYIKSFGLALIAVCFTYGGYQQTINFGEEVKNPRKNLPRGIFIGIMVIIGLYLLVSYSYYKMIGFEDLRTSKGIASIVAERLFGETGKYIFSILLFVAVLAYVNVILLSNPRVMYAMAEDGILPEVFKKRNGKGVLTFSLSVYALISVGSLFFLDTFDKILGFSIFLDCIGMAFSAATIFILRKRKLGDEGEIYKVPFKGLLPILFIATYLFVALSIAIDQPSTALTGVGVLLGFMLFYVLVLSKRKRPSVQTEN